MEQKASLAKQPYGWRSVDNNSRKRQRLVDERREVLLEELSEQPSPQLIEEWTALLQERDRLLHETFDSETREEKNERMIELVDVLKKFRGVSFDANERAMKRRLAVAFGCALDYCKEHSIGDFAPPPPVVAPPAPPPPPPAPVPSTITKTNSNNNNNNNNTQRTTTRKRLRFKRDDSRDNNNSNSNSDSENVPNNLGLSAQANRRDNAIGGGGGGAKGGSVGAAPETPSNTEFSRDLLRHIRSSAARLQPTPMKRSPGMTPMRPAGARTLREARDDQDVFRLMLESKFKNTLQSPLTPQSVTSAYDPNNSVNLSGFGSADDSSLSPLDTYNTPPPPPVLHGDSPASRGALLRT